MINLSFNDVSIIKSAVNSKIEDNKKLASICPEIAESLNKEIAQCERIISILDQVQDKTLENRNFRAQLSCQL
jgi:transcriptional regulator